MQYTSLCNVLVITLLALATTISSSGGISVREIDTVNPLYSSDPRTRDLRSRDQCPGKYSFGIPLVDVVHHRSAKEDTIYIAAAVAVQSGGSYTVYNVTKSYGKHGNGNFSAGIEFTDIPVGDNDVALFTYLIVNAGHGSQQSVEAEIAKAVIAVATQGAKIASTVVIDDLIGALSRIIGFAFDGIVGWIIGFIGDGIVELVTEGCDGYLAAGLHAFSGEQICSNSVPLSGIDVNDGSSDEELFGFIPGVICSSTPSLYDVEWDVHE